VIADWAQDPQRSRADPLTHELASGWLRHLVAADPSSGS
jgi:hypothetical protein